MQGRLTPLSIPKYTTGIEVNASAAIRNKETGYAGQAIPLHPVGALLFLSVRPTLHTLRS